jgi:hypothetical protein
MLMLPFAPEPPPASGTSVDTIYYVLASVALVAGFFEGMRRFLSRQRKKWVDEAEAVRAARENSERLAANTEAIARLTDTQAKLGVQMSDFIAGVHTELNGLGKRVTRLEFFQSRRNHPANGGNGS